MPNFSSLPASSPAPSNGLLSPLTAHQRHLSAKEKLLSLSRRQMRTLESWYQDNPKPSRFSKIVLIESFGGDKSQVGAIHLWFVLRRRIERKERSRAPILLAPIPNRRGLSPVPPHYPLSRSPSLFRPRCRRDTGGTSFSDAMDVALQFQQFSLASRRPSLVKMDSDCSPLDDQRMLDVEFYDVTTTRNIRRKSVKKVKDWMDGSHNGGSPNMPTENERNNHLWPPGHTVTKSTASSYDEGYHSRSSMDMRAMDLDHHSRSPSGLFPEASLSPSKSDRSEYLLTPPDLQMTVGVFEWNMDNSFIMESPNPVMIPPPCPEVTCCIFPPNDSVAQTAVPDVVVFGAEPNPMLENQPRRLSDDSQMPASNGETEDFEDGALSLWTEEIQKTVNLPEYIEPSRLEWFRNRFHLAFSQRSRFYPTDACSVPQDDGEGQATANDDHGDDGMTPTSSSDKTRGTLKRRRKSEEDEDNNNRSRRLRPGQNTGVLDGGDEESARLLACPFCKWKPLTYRSCQGMILREIARVKQHLLRVHQVPIHCPLCSREFPGELQRDEHVRQRTCELRPLRTWEGVTADQKAAIRRRVDPTKSKREQWNGIYAILFPGQPLPENPYVERLLSTELQTLQDFFSQEWPPTFQRLISRLPEEVRSQETIIQALSTFIFETGVAEILERFSAARDGSVSPDSGYSSRAVPEQRELEQRPMQEVPPVTEPPAIWVMPPTNDNGDNGDNYTLDANPNPNAGNYTLHPTPDMPMGSPFNEAYFLSDDILLDWHSAWAHPSPGQGQGGPGAPGGPAGNAQGQGHLGIPGQMNGM